MIPAVAYALGSVIGACMDCEKIMAHRDLPGHFQAEHGIGLSAAVCRAVPVPSSDIQKLNGQNRVFVFWVRRPGDPAPEVCDGCGDPIDGVGGLRLCERCTASGSWAPWGRA